MAATFGGSDRLLLFAARFRLSRPLDIGFILCPMPLSMERALKLQLVLRLDWNCTPMKYKLLSIAAALILAAMPIVIAQAPDRPKAVKAQTKLWAAVSVSQPIFDVRGIDQLQMHFTVVNDGETTVNPRIGSSHLLINGTEPKDWRITINNGPRDSSFDSLPPGRSVLFGYAMGRLFAKPGIYTVRWQGENFRAPDLTFRVVAAL